MQGENARRAPSGVPKNPKPCAKKAFSHPPASKHHRFSPQRRGVNWARCVRPGAAHLLLMNTNRIPIYVRLMSPARVRCRSENPRAAKTASTRSPARSRAPYAMFRTPLFGPGGPPATLPPGARWSAVDLFSGKKVWDVPLGSYMPGMSRPPLTSRDDRHWRRLVFAAAAVDTNSHLRLRTARNSGNRLPAAARPLP